MRSLWIAAVVLILGGSAWAQEKQPEAAPKERVSLAPNTGGHARPVQALTFTPDGQRLVTISDSEVMVWNVASGDLERTWRLPTSLSLLAASPDNKTLAVARWVGGPNNPVWLLNLATGRTRTVRNLPCGSYEASCLAFSPDGERLAWSTVYHAGVFEVKTGRHTHVTKRLKELLSTVTFNKDGTQLLITSGYNPAGVPFFVVDLSAVTGGKLPLEMQKARFILEDRRSSQLEVAWAPDGSRFASINRERSNEIFLWGANGKRERVKGKDGKVTYRTITVPGMPLLPSYFSPPLLKFVGSDKVIIANELKGQVHAALVDLNSAKVERANKIGYWHRGPTHLAVTDDGNKLAAYSGPGFQATLLNLATNKWARRFGPNQFRPNYLSWGRDSRSIAWGLEGKSKDKQPLEQNLHGGLSLQTLEPLRPGQFQGFRSRTEPKGWRLVHEDAGKRKSQKAGWTLLHDGKRTELDAGGSLRNSLSYTDAAGNPRVILCSDHHIRGGFWIYDGDTGKRLATIKDWGYVHDLVISPDKKFLLVSEGGQVLDLYRIDGRPAHLLSILVAGQDWVAWTPQGYYEATPVGETKVGWTSRKDNFTPLTFYPMERFRKQLHRPDIVKLVLDKGSVSAAVKSANEAGGGKARDVTVDQLLPPRATLAVLDDKALPQVKVKASAVAVVVGQPVTALRLLVDGRPLPGGAALAEFGKGQPQAEAEWTVTLPEGPHHLTVLARSPDASGVSPVVAVSSAAVEKLPVLHVLAVGVDAYEDASLRLQFAAADARAIAAAFGRNSKGGLFGDVSAAVLVNDKARREAVLKDLADLRKKVGPNDLVVFFFAGHGVKAKDHFYLLTVEAKTDDLPATTLSGEDLRKALAEFPCQVLLMLDACHSSASLKSLRPAVDDVTRALTEDEVGVAVLCAAMAHEKALERSGHGLFTLAVTQALGKAEGVPFNRHNRKLYVHHLHSYVFDEVSRLSDDRQHPFLNLPWVVESFPVTQFGPPSK